MADASNRLDELGWQIARKNTEGVLYWKRFEKGTTLKEVFGTTEEIALDRAKRIETLHED